MKHWITALLLMVLVGCAQSQDSRTHSASADAQKQVAMMSEQNNQLDSALNIYQRLYKKKPDAEINLALGRLYYKSEQWVLAQTHLEQIEEDQPEWAKSRIWMAKTQLKLSNPELAFVNLPTDINTNELRNLKAVTLDYLQRHEEAQALYMQVLAADKLDVKARRNLVYSQILSGDYREAEVQLVALYELGVRDRQRDMLAAIVALLQQDDPKAVRTLEGYSSPYEVEQLLAQLESLKATQ
ncbi:tetratricopeptide repeat protein [Vibrio tapetis]|uniref:Uncharacterized protein n=1 Tax=Vibrio tapetis subsp. tapetis TaxID=1671868 RepID=A0A2N8ZDG2_9VIBR|nr:tetratricopeptide repeat protein [Vibrio tapetis]SON49952.1 conserved exported protein of unknown function [Vibrio tapetis subsp. tapetis]